METRNGNYEDRIVCFIDILAFKELIESTIDKGVEILDRTDFIKSLFSRMINELQNEDLKIQLDDGRFDQVVKVTHFSDCIVLSVSLNEIGSLFYTLNGLQFFLMEVLRHGVLFRGGITIGKIHHEGNTVFGPALNMAYFLESTIASNPRIIINMETINEYLDSYRPKHNKEEETRYILSLLSKDDDDYFYIDFLNIDFDQFDDPSDGLTYMHHLRTIIIDNVKKYDHIPSVRKKNSWLIKKFNKMIVDKNREHHIKFQQKYGIKKIERKQIL